MADTEDTRRTVVRADNADIDNHIAGYSDLIKDAAQADQIEHEMGVRQALRIHKKAVFWSMALSAALIVRTRIREAFPVVVLTRITYC
jgi:hypothetical protein